MKQNLFLWLAIRTHPWDQSVVNVFIFSSVNRLYFSDRNVSWIHLKMFLWTKAVSSWFNRNVEAKEFHMGTPFAKWRIFCPLKKKLKLKFVPLSQSFKILRITVFYRILLPSFRCCTGLRIIVFLENLPAKFPSHCTGCVLKIFEVWVIWFVPLDCGTDRPFHLRI